MLTMFCFDWLRFTAPTLDARDELLRTFPELELDKDVIAGKGVYTDGQRILLGGKPCGTIEWAPKHPEWKVSFTFSGSDLLNWRGNVAPGQLIMFPIEWGYNITRVDLALDVLHPDGELQELAQAVESGSVTTRTKTNGVIRSRNAESDKGLTIYLGSRQSDKYVRLYHKGAQMGTDDNWVRLEIEAKGDYALALSKRLAKMPEGDAFMQEAAKLAKSELRATLGCEVAWYNEALRDETVPLISVERKRSKSERWAFTTLLEMCRNAAREFPDWGSVAIKTIQHEIDRE